MHSIPMNRPPLPDLPAHLMAPLLAVCAVSAQEIPTALNSLGFSLSRPALLVLGTLPEHPYAAQEVCFRYCAEVIAPLGEQHSVVVVTDGKRGGLAEVLGDVREACPFELLGVKRAEAGDASGETIDLFHSHLLTLREMPEEHMLAARLRIIRLLASKPLYHRMAVVCMGGDESTWAALRAVLAANFHVVVVGGSGGIAGEIAKVRAYLQEIHRIYPWGTPRPEPPYPLETLSLEAAGLLSLYTRPEMWLSVCDGEENTDHLYHQLKREFHIHLNK